MRYLVAGSIVVVAILVSLYAYLPYAITWAEIVPRDISYEVGSPESIDRALIAAYRAGRAVVHGAFETPLMIQSAALIATAVALAFVIVRGKHAV